MKLIASALALMFAAGAAIAQDAAPDAATDAAPEAEAGAETGQKASAQPPAAAEGPDTVAVTFEDGRWFNAEDIPTYRIEDGKVDFATFSGFRRYHSECHVCHGPDGEGSSFAPALKNVVAHKLDYYEFQQIVASGMQDVGASANLVMPAFGTNRNVWCYVDDIYTYLLARGTDALPRGRPASHEDKPEEFAKLEDSCMGG